MKIRLTVSPQAERYVRRDGPVEVRRMAARGALPLPPAELATVLFVLLHDPDDQTKARARESLEGLPRSIVVSVLSGPAHPSVLSYLGRAHPDDAELLEKLALNPDADDATVAWLATLPHKRLVDIVSNNQQRMLRCPDIVEALGSNPLTGRSVIDRILSFLGVQKTKAEEPDEAAPEGEDLPPCGEVTDEAALAALRAVLGDDVGDFAKELLEETGELDESQRGSMFALIQTLSVFQKVKLARMGNKEARGLLIRDRNKIVAAAAIRSPKITENEVESFAKMRALSDEVLRIIASNREWTRNYTVKVNLAMNPKVPASSAVKFLNYLQDRDLLTIMKSKDVPSVISTHARRILTKKGKI
ncbi:MAG TPA: hypothetical protein DEP35_00125 [Deltaproteobacteria bacterium]|jgi:hypothetical protein|nr:hypothetical protein [Deltaproteobacteria bacterium]